MKITVSRDGVVIGVYERADIRGAVADGSLHLDDRYFMQGMREWLPLSNLTKTLGARPTADKNTPEDQSIPSSARHSWKRTVTSAGYAIVIVAIASALFNPNYWAQALAAAAGVMLIFAAQTLP